jgi:hypothetical protein
LLNGGIIIKERKYWTKEEEQFIADNISEMSISELSKHFDICYQKMYDKIHKMGLNSKKARGIYWSEEEDKIFRENYPYASKHYLESLLPNRKWSQIKSRGSWLHIKRISQDRYYVDHNFFSKWTEASAYFLGFILADGYIHYGKSKWLSIHLAEKDLCILQKFKELIQYEGPIKKQKSRNCIIGNHVAHATNSYDIRINNAKIILDLIDKGISKENKTFEAKFPQNIPDDMMCHFIRGLIDGDGSIIFRSYRQRSKALSIEIYGTEDIVRGVRDHVNVDCSDIKLYNRSWDHYWMFQVSGKRAKEIADWLYKDATIFLPRKYEKYKECCDYMNDN